MCDPYRVDEPCHHTFPGVRWRDPRLLGLTPLGSRRFVGFVMREYVVWEIDNLASFGSRTMPQSLAKIYLHIVFSTKDRRPFLQDAELRADLHAYLAGICRNLDTPSIRIGGVEDHVHILCYLSRTITVADLVRNLKRDSSKWLKTRSPDLAEFHWQDGYGVFSVSPSHVDLLTEYILNQEEHHRTESFQDEFRRLLRKYDVEFDERYLWD